MSLLGPLVATAEFEPVDALLITWDSDYSDFFSTIISELNRKTEVYVLVQDLYEERAAREHLSWEIVDVDSIQFVLHRRDTIWIRDYGPISVRLPGGNFAFIDSEYCDDRPFDDSVPTNLAQYFGVPVLHSGLTLDGGNFLTNGKGLCVMTDLIDEDNPKLNQAEIADRLNTYFGCKKIVVLHRLIGEETGHVDIFAKLISQDTILLGQYKEEQDPLNSFILDSNASQLGSVILEDNRSLSVIRIPMGSNDDGVFRNYANSLYLNGTVIIPTYNTDRELNERAIEIYKKALPQGTRIVPVDASTIIEQEGAVHCITQSLKYWN
jgi:agmatine/peptidylarginine deiminase